MQPFEIWMQISMSKCNHGTLVAHSCTPVPSSLGLHYLRHGTPLGLIDLNQYLELTPEMHVAKA